MTDLTSDHASESGVPLPTPPLRLRRLHLEAVGPDGARFDPLDLDFTVAGNRAADRVLLSLTNTGGKSTLITLVSSLIVPRARATVGAKNLGDYVLTGDTSHVVAEWEDDTTGYRTVTGAVMEWKDGRRQPGHKQRSTRELNRAWYLFRTGPGLPGIDDLPFRTDQTRTPLDTFIAAVHDLIGTHTDTLGVVARSQQDWANALEDRTSIDPVLFEYQMRMNDSESGAEKLLASFDTPDNVVRFFVSALNDDRQIADLLRNLGEYAAVAGNRDVLTELASFGDETTGGLHTIAARAETAATQEREAVQASTAAGEHAAAIVNRLEQDRDALADLDQQREEAARTLETARREYGRMSDIRLQLVLEAARHQATVTEEQLDVAADDEQAAELDADAWAAVDAIVQLDEARVRRDHAHRAYDAAEQGLSPLRHQVEVAAAKYAARLEALIAETADGMSAVEGQKEQAKDDRGAAATASTNADRAITNIQNLMSGDDTVVAGHDDAVTAATDEGWLHVGETASAAQARWQELQDDHEARASNARDVEGAETGKARDAQQAVDDLADPIAAATSAKDTADAVAARFNDEFSKVAALDTVIEVLGSEPGSVEDIRRAAETADRIATRADSAAGGHETRADEARTELAYLDTTGTAPAGPDVLAVVAALDGAGIGAVTGLDWVAVNIVDTDLRASFINQHPAVAGGVIVSDRNRFSTAVDHLQEVSLSTRTPVTVATPPTTPDGSGGNEPDGSTARHVVLPHRATWDREWAARRRDELETVIAERTEAATTARSQAARHRDTVAVCRQFASGWAGYTIESLTEAAAAADAALAALVTQRSTLRDARELHTERAQTARDEAAVADGAARSAAAIVDAAAELVKSWDAATAARQRRSRLELDLAKARQERDDATTAAERAQGHLDTATETLSEMRQLAERLRDERADLPVDEVPVDPGGSRELLKSTWVSLQNRLRTEEAGLREPELLNQAEVALTQAQQRTATFPEAVVAGARERAGSTMASTATTRQAEQQRARRRLDQARRTRLSVEAAVEAANRAVEAAEPQTREHRNHFDLSNTPEWFPATPADIPAIQERFELQVTAVRERRDVAEAESGAADELHAAVTIDIDSFADTMGLWDGAPVPSARVYSGDRATARTQMQELLRREREAVKSHAAAQDDVRDAVTAIRAVVNAPRWRALNAPAVLRVRGLADGDLVAEASQLARDIDAMSKSAHGDLAALDVHRGVLRDELVSVCRDQRRLLREVSKAARLPAGLGDLSGQTAIKIDFKEGPENETAVRLADRIDRWADELVKDPKRATSGDVRARWLADAVRDTVVDRPRAGCWTIEILKPRIDGQTAYCPPDRIPHEFSGGQVLTLAVLVYCALSSVRAAHRIGGARPPGCLILDNPFGAASAEALIGMQHRLAAAVGLQLVCATGLHDAGVDAAFSGPGSVITKLRNDGDLRRNLSFLRLRDTIVDGVDVLAGLTGGRDQDDARNYLDAARYEVHGR